MAEQEAREDIGLISELLAFVADLGCRHPWAILLATLLSCGICLLCAFRGLEYQTQRNDLISSKKSYLQRWQQYIAEFGDDDDMVVVVQGSERTRMQSAIEDLAAALKNETELFDRVFYKVDLRHLRRRGLLFLGSDQIRPIQDSLRNMTLLLEPPVLGGLDPLFGWKSLTVSHLLHEAERRVAAVKVQKASKADDDFLRQLEVICSGGADFVEDSRAYRNPWQSILPDAPADQQNQLDEAQYFFSGDQSLAFLLVRPVKDQNGFNFAQKSIDGMRRLISDLEGRFPELKIGLTGLPVLENDEMVASQSDSNFASWLALVGVALLYLLAYRGYRYPLMTVVTLLVGTIWALGWMTLTVGHINILSSAFAVMLIGMGDYGVLWVTRFGQERQDGADVRTAMYTTAISVGPGILTAAFTTALAFYATMFADLKAVAELGWIAGTGVLLCALSCFVVMPALLAVLDFRPARREDSEAVILSLKSVKENFRQWLPGLTHRPQLVLPATLAITAVLGYFALSIHYDHNLLHLQASSMDSVQWEHKLIEHTTGTSWHALSYTTTPEEALALKARYEKLPEVGRVVEVASLVPLDQERKLEQLRDIQERLRRLPERGKIIAHGEPDVPGLLSTARNLLRSMDGMEDEKLRTLKRTLEHFVTRLEQAGSEAAGRLRQFQELFTRDLAEDLHRLRDVSRPERIELADLPTSLRERYIGKNGKWLLRIFAKDCLWEFNPLERFVAQVCTVDSEATGKPFSTLEGLRVMKNGFFLAGIYAGIAMVIVLLLDFGNCKHTLLALAPLALGLVATLGIMVLFGVALNPANMIAFPLILGVGADNGVHVLHDYRSRARGRRYSLSYATGRGIMVAALTTILGFGTLMISQHRGLASLGLVLTMGVTCCMLTALVFLPALLHVVSIRRERSTASGPARKSA